MGKKQFITKLKEIRGEEPLIPKILTDEKINEWSNKFPDGYNIGEMESNILYDFLEQHNLLNFIVKKIESDNIMLIEEGSINIDILDSLGINYIVYRAGSMKPCWIENKTIIDKP